MSKKIHYTRVKKVKIKASSAPPTAGNYPAHGARALGSREAGATGDDIRHNTTYTTAHQSTEQQTSTNHASSAPTKRHDRRRRPDPFTSTCTTKTAAATPQIRAPRRNNLNNTCDGGPEKAPGTRRQNTRRHYSQITMLLLIVLSIFLPRAVADPVKIDETRIFDSSDLKSLEISNCNMSPSLQYCMQLCAGGESRLSGLKNE